MHRSESHEEQEGRTRTGSWIWSPFSMMRRMSEEMDRLADDMGLTVGEREGAGSSTQSSTSTSYSEESETKEYSTGGKVHERNFAQQARTPDVEMIKRGDQVVVRADLPGVSKEDLNVDYNDDSITIRGVRREPKDEHVESRYRSERFYGPFYRTVTLPSGVKARNATATFRDGVLEIVVQASNGGQAVDIQ
jgi:HSP20 family protein